MGLVNGSLDPNCLLGHMLIFVSVVARVAKARGQGALMATRDLTSVCLFSRHYPVLINRTIALKGYCSDEVWAMGILIFCSAIGMVQ